MPYSDKFYDFVENIYKLAEHYINIVEYNSHTKIATVDMSSAKICASAAERMLDAVSTDSDAPLINLLWEILYEYSTGFDFLVSKGPFLSGYDYVSYYLYLAKFTTSIMFVLTNWVEDPKSGNGFSLLKLVPAARCSGDILYFDYVESAGIEAHFAPLMPLYLVAKNGTTTFQLNDFSGDYKTIVDLKNIEAPFDRKSILPPNLYVARKYSIE